MAYDGELRPTLLEAMHAALGAWKAADQEVRDQVEAEYGYYHWLAARGGTPCTSAVVAELIAARDAAYRTHQQAYSAWSDSRRVAA